MIEVLLRPKLLSFKNKWSKQSLAKRRSQDVVLFCFSLLVMLGMYCGARWAIRQINGLPFLVYLPPSVPLGLLMFVLMAMLSISSLATSLGNFYFAEDVDLILASPVSMLRFFLARFTYILFSVSWMPFIFLFPVLAAFARNYQAPWDFFIYALVVLAPYFIIPAAVATIISSLVMAIFTPKVTKLLVGVALGGLVFGIFFVIEITGGLLSNRGDPDQILRFVSTMSISQASWSPSSWASAIISEILMPFGRNALARYILLYATAIACTSLAYLGIELLHSRGYTRARNTYRATGRDSVNRFVRRRITRPWFAIVVKEYRSIFRDLAQSSQVIFLGCICLMYLSNLRVFISLDAFTPDMRLTWQKLFFMMHTSITAFFTSSMCTRMVFSSVSLEGKQFWLLQTAPISMRDLLRSKFAAWLFPISFVSLVLFSVGTFVIVGRIDFLIFFAILSFFVSYGIVGMGIGLGAVFADFAWEHPSQLALSLGSFVYMLASALLVIINVIPMSIMLNFQHRSMLGSSPQYAIMFILLGSVIALINVLAARAAMRIGENSLLKGAS